MTETTRILSPFPQTKFLNYFPRRPKPLFNTVLVVKESSFVHIFGYLMCTEMFKASIVSGVCEKTYKMCTIFTVKFTMDEE